MRRILILSVVTLAGILVAGARNNSSELPEFGNGRQAVVVQKNFELCFHLSRNQKLSSIISADSVLSEIAQDGRALFQKAETEEDALQEVLLSEQEIAAVGDRLSAMVSKPEIKSLCTNLKKGGKYFIFNELSDGDFLKAAWTQDAGGINMIIRVYALGEKPRYKIDVPDPNLSKVPFYEKAMSKLIRPAIRETALEITRNGLFFSLPLEVALEYLDLSNRYEAADFEPMEKGINAGSYAAARRTKWKDYPYSAILVLGSGPQVEGEAISPKGRVRCAYAVELYRQGKAPFIILSGGRAHPAMTAVSEAEEMMRYLMDNYGIPQQALIADPHARHTTSNIRNAVRIMLKNGFPAEKPALMTSTYDQLDYVQTKEFENRCVKEMLVMSYRLGERTGSRTLEFWPLPCASQINPLDPLDP